MTTSVSDIMDRAASLLNDSAKSIFTYAIQMPLLNAAIDELQEAMQLNSVAAVNLVSSVIHITSGVIQIAPPELPPDLITPQGLLEREFGACTPFMTMTKQEFFVYDQGQQNSLNVWSWQGQVINLIGANTDREVIINYVGAILPKVVASTDTLKLFNCESFLAYRTAALCANFIGENKARADELDQFAALAIERFLKINSKGNTQIIMPRKPYVGVFRAKDEN
jgi:hypothetical protein